MDQMGTEIAKMHLADVIHGDLTTSNMMIRQPVSSASPNESTSSELVGFLVLTNFCLLLFEFIYVGAD